MNTIELEDKETLLAWLEEFNRLPEDDDRITLPHIPHSYPSIRRELLRRAMIETLEEDLKNGDFS